MADLFTEFKHKQRAATGHKGHVSKKSAFGRHIKNETILGWDFVLHATKGWRQENVKRRFARLAMIAMRGPYYKGAA